MVGLSDAEVVRRITREEWRLHCRRRTRGAEESTLLIQELLDTFGGPAGHNTLDIPLLDALRIQEIWRTQRPHLSCIQDPPGVQLYTQTGRLTKGGVSLPVYRCARGSTSLESFHLHLNRFIPGTRASAMHFQAFLVDGLARWNEDRAAAAAPPVAAEEQVGPLHSYSGHLKHVLNQKSQRVLGLPMVKDFTKPAEYTGELIGVEYLYQQTGRVLEVVSLDPDTPDEAAAIESLGEDEDEGIGEDVEDPTIFEPHTLSASTVAAARSESEEEMEGPDGQPGYQHVLRLAQALLEARSLLGLSDKRVDRLIVLWNRLPEHDRGRVDYPPRFRERQPKGRFKQGKGKNTPFPGKESLQRCLLGPYSGPASWPSTSRLVEAICSQLCRLYPSDTRVLGVKRTRWSLVLSDYVAIRAAVLASPRLMAQTDIQLFELNQRTLSKWFSERQKQQGQAVLLQATGIVPVAALAGEPLPPAKGLSCVQAGQGQPFHFNVPEEQPGPSTTGLPTPPPPPSSSRWGATRTLIWGPTPHSSTTAPGSCSSSSSSSSWTTDCAQDNGAQEEEGGRGCRCRAGTTAREQTPPADNAVHLPIVWPAQKAGNWPHTCGRRGVLRNCRREIGGGVDCGEEEGNGQRTRGPRAM
ncbi:hypothetical protein PFLUV_G00210310 [Perca fluviatilis]|uniref:Uncharacterized protein n=1 Tax=Perca fluviatilis TaxID=8168 RepID=A0A6A5EJZ8_PERFL|nr:hypothetical protein PFLUV_G00210310 [Perca fluviatilis]